VQRIIDFSELGEFIDVPVRAYSSGMHVRLGFAIAAHLDADILLVDEVLAVGDEGFQRKCLERIAQRIEAGTTLVLVSHDPGAIERVCERVVVLDHGRVAFDGPAPEGLLHYHRMMGTERAPGDMVGPSKHRTVFVQEVELQDAEGRRRASFPTGGPMRMVFLVTAREAVPDAQIVLEVRTAAGHPVFLTRRRLELTARETRLAFDVPRLALLGGDYDLVVSAHSISDPNPGIDRVAGFAVKADADAEGVTDLRGEWRELDAERISG
jgi:energy-coupling factor transporter ATP-binding protein EcfA2